MKIKYIFLIFILLTICGCNSVKNEKVEDIIATVGDKIKDHNTYHTGFKYYLPKGMKVTKTTLYNDVIETENLIFYLYADIISYYNKTPIEYTTNEDAYYSAKLDSDGLFGYLEINFEENDQYLIEIMFNYAKIEVMVSETDINLALNYAVAILRSIEYNDVVIASLVGEDVLNFQEEVYDIFETTKSDSNYLKYSEIAAVDENQEENIKDSDLIVDESEENKDSDLIN